MRKDLVNVKDLFCIEILDVSVSVGNGFIQGGDVIDVIYVIEYNKDKVLVMFGGCFVVEFKVINVCGDSMVLIIELGDFIFVDISINQFDGDGIYVFGFDDKIYVKRLQMIFDKLLVIFDNINYREWSIIKDNECRFGVFGKVLISQMQLFK